MHGQGLGHFFRPFCPSVGSPYNPATSESYHSDEDTPADALVAVVASFGLETSFLTAAIGSMQFKVNGERKAKVLTYVLHPSLRCIILTGLLGIPADQAA